jgi:hypothetical protein
MRWVVLFLCFFPLSLLGKELRAINLFGLETELAFQCGLSCCWVKPNDYYIDKVADMGFNSIRLPFSAEYIKNGNLTLMDQIIQKTEERNLDVILDYHRTWSGHQGDWYETNLDDFLDVWDIVLTRYNHYQNVKYVDLYNEFQQPNTPENVKFWNNIMTQAILHIEDKYPYRYNYFVGGTNWGGNLNGIKVNVPADVDNRVAYTIHKYKFSVQGDYLHDYEISFGGYSGDKLFVGEFGWIQSDETQRQWGKMFLDYLKSKGIKNTALWCLSWFSGDTQGVLKQNCLDVEEEKLKMLKDFWGDHRGLVEDKIFRGSDRIDNLIKFISNSSYDIVMDEAGDDDDTDDWGDDEDGDRLLQNRWGRRRKCHFLNGDEDRCERHHKCCYRRYDDLCFKCI